MKVLGIAGSPRRQGNTERLLDRFLAGATEEGAPVQKVVVPELEVAGCIACQGCWDDGRCVILDEFQPLYRQLIDADVIALATPRYYMNVTAQLKAVIDRSQCQWARKYVLEAPLRATPAGHRRRRGVLISVGGAPVEDFSGVERTVRAFFDIQEADYWAALLLSGVDEKGAIEEHPAALQRAYALGRRAVTEPWDREGEER
jgi:putative NADPH-quinone reductase